MFLVTLVKTYTINTNHPQFFTATILDWKHLLRPDKYKDVIIDSLRFLVKENRVQVNAFTIMINHIHLIWQVQGRFQREAVQRDFLKYVSQKIIKDLKFNHPDVLQKFYVGAKDRKYQIWERNALGVDLISKDIFFQKFDYVHYNAVTAGLCSVPESYKYSSANFYETGYDEFGFLSHWAA